MWERERKRRTREGEKKNEKRNVGKVREGKGI